MKIKKSNPVLVTGATGYVAGWVVKRLLDEGLTVHAAVRNTKDKSKLQYLEALAEKSPGTIKFFEADLLKSGSYDEAMQNCEIVFHTASPFSLNVKNVQTQLIEPALNGTKNVLESVNRTQSVQRVVLTSSVAAMYGDNADLLNLPDRTVTEEAWNTSSNEKHQPYSYSKMLAEREAWNICKAQDRWQMVVINPSFVLGPGISPTGTSESQKMMLQIGNGTYKSGVPDFAIGMVDVRDVAEAHFQAAFNPAASGRYITSGHNADFLTIAGTLSKKYGNAYPFPKKTIPKFLLMILGPFMGLKIKMLRRNIGIPFKADNSKIKNDLGIRFRNLEETIVDHFQQMIDNQLVKPAK
jgi:dihydroflavonol-4-reductase